ncbi:MAG: amidohydrolase family protein [Bacteroidota bacterium]
MGKQLIQEAHIVLPDRVIKGDIRIENGRIAEIADYILEEKSWEINHCKGKYLLPGFIDIHTHGAYGFDFALGVYNAENDTFSHEAYEEGLNKALKHYVSCGATRIYPTTFAAPLGVLEQAFKHLSTCIEDTHFPYEELVGGINLEGTFLKLPAFAGAQNPNFFYPASLATFEQLDWASGGRLCIVNIPPDHGPTGLHMTRFLSQKGIVVAGGHTGAMAKEFGMAVDAGLNLAVHFLNGPSQHSEKSFFNGGAEEEILRRDEVFLELIVDGYHVHPSYVRDVIARKGYERVILITDSMFARDCTDIKHFSLEGIYGEVGENREYLRVLGKADTLFGSVLRSDKGFENVLNWLTQDMIGIWYREHKALNLPEALVYTSQMASGNPARLLGIYENENHSGTGTGSIEVGKWADLVLVEVQEPSSEISLAKERSNELGLPSNSFQVRVEDVWLRGNKKTP